MPANRSQLAITAALAQYQSQRETRTLNLRWRDKDTDFPVLRIPVGQVFLNPHSRRIRSLLESHPEAALVEAAPFSDAAQAVIAKLLTRNPVKPTEQDKAYLRLQEDLRDAGQREPGVVTREGILINANTRCVALRELGREYLLAALLPDGATERDLQDLEIEIQVRPTHQREYPFADQLLLVHDLVLGSGLPVAEVAHRIGRKERSVNRMLRIIDRIRQLQAQGSVKDANGRTSQLPLTWFNDKQQSLEEMDTLAEKMKAEGRSQDEIDQMLHVRLAGMLAGFTKLELRNVSATFSTVHLVPQLHTTPLASYVGSDVTPHTASSLNIPGLGFSIPTPSPESSRLSLRPLLTVTAKATTAALFGTLDASLRPAGQPNASPEDVRQNLRSAMERAISTAQQSHSRTSVLELPGQCLDDVIAALRSCEEAVEAVASDDDFIPETLLSVIDDAEARLGGIRNRLRALAEGGAKTTVPS